MPIRDANPAYFTPSGLSDAVDESSAFAGACQQLTNFLFDRVSRGAVVPRPGAVAISFSTSGFTTPGVVSAAFMVGNLIYGMIGTADFAGKDRPFVYNVTTGTFVTVTNVSAALLPATQSTVGDWVPPKMDMIGQYVVVTHPGFSGGANPFFGWFDLTTPGTIKWNAGNTATTVLPSVPLTVSQFFGRAYFACGNKVIPTDILNPLNVTATEFSAALTIGDSTNVTGSIGLPIGTATQGVLQALLIFKAKSIWQITGDLSLNTLALNQLSSNVGTLAPNTLCTTPQGVAFMASDGVRLVNLVGQTPFLNQDVVAPFSQITTPSRSAAVYANSVLRISANTNFKSNVVNFNDYWFDTQKSKWNGPHTFPFHIVVTDGTTTYGAVNTINGNLFQSDVAPSNASVYQDNGANYNSQYVSCNLEENNNSVDKQFVESTIELSTSTVNSNYNIQARDDKGNVLGAVTINVANAGSSWGTGVWGTMVWRAAVPTSSRFGIPWAAPVVYDKLVMNVTVQAAQFVGVKQLMNRVQLTNHMAQNF